MTCLSYCLWSKSRAISLFSRTAIPYSLSLSFVSLVSLSLCVLLAAQSAHGFFFLVVSAVLV
eukprot:m.225953 g.225953  ORF g.225953 m.225953 type:complete len:62 (+) comp16834_c0_seq1:1440-1625(+)